MLRLIEIIPKRPVPQSLRIFIVTIDRAFPKPRYGPQILSHPVTSSQQIHVTLIPRPSLRARTLKLGSQVTTSSPHIRMRQSRNKNVGHVDTQSILLNILSLAASRMISWDPLHKHSLFNQLALHLRDKGI